MQTSRLLVAAVVAVAIGAPIAGFFADMKGQPIAGRAGPATPHKVDHTNV